MQFVHRSLTLPERKLRERERENKMLKDEKVAEINSNKQTTGTTPALHTMNPAPTSRTHAERSGSNTTN